MKTDRKFDRFIRRLETEFIAEDKSYRGISSDLSQTGLFIRTNHAFAPGSILDIKIYLPDGAISKMKGKVMRAFKTPIISLKNGMGVVLLEKDSHYINFMKTFSPDIQDNTSSESTASGTEAQAKPDKKAEPDSSDFLILTCSKCGAKNKVYKSKTAFGPKCGKCKSPLIINLA